MTRTSNKQYPDEEFPWNFYFNGVLMPKWGACWGLAQLPQLLKPEEDWDNEVGHRDVYLIYCRIDHLGVAESAEPDVFIYAMQEVLCILLSQKDSVMEALRSGSVSANAEEIYQGLLSAVLQMRRLTSEQHLAFWTSGYEEDRQRLLQSMERAQLPTSHPNYEPAPHQRRRASMLASNIQYQRARLHALAQSGKFPKDLRRELYAI